MLRQVLRHFRLRMLGEVSGRSDYCHAHIRPDAYGDHVLRNLLAQPNASIITICDDVAEAVVEKDLRPNVRIVG